MIGGGGGSRYGVYGVAQNGPSENQGGHFEASGPSGSTNYGIWATASGGASNWAGYFAGNIVANGVTLPSDEMFKTKRQDMQGVLAKVMLLKPEEYYYDTTTYSKMSFSSKKQFGLVAQDIEQVFPEMVTEVVAPSDAEKGTNGKQASQRQAPQSYKGVNYIALIPILVGAIQEQQAQIEELKARLGGAR